MKRDPGRKRSHLLQLDAVTSAELYRPWKARPEDNQSLRMAEKRKIRGPGRQPRRPEPSSEYFKISCTMREKATVIEIIAGKVHDDRCGPTLMDAKMSGPNVGETGYSHDLKKSISTKLCNDDERRRATLHSGETHLSQAIKVKITSNESLSTPPSH